MTDKNCEICFWNDVSLKNWPDFEAKEGVDKEKRIQEIKIRKCKACKDGIEENFSEKWTCKKCGVVIDGHQEFFHGSLCFNCWDAKVNKINNKKS